MNTYDNIIIGCGIAGLYFAYKLTKLYPNQSFILLEKNNKIGGRAGNEIFHGVSVPIGAGIGRYNKDFKLRELLQELNIPIQKNKIKLLISNTVEPFDIKKTINFLQNKYTNQSCTFKDFALTYLSKSDYKKFIQITGLTDYENEDVYETLFYYGMEDNISDWFCFYVNWNLLLKTLVQNIGKHKIKLNTEVINYKKENDNIYIKTNKTNYICKKLIIATDINCIRKLIKAPIYSHIKSQPFIRIYAKFSGISKQLMNFFVINTTIVNSILYKIIPIAPDKGIYMIAYSDNNAVNKLNILLNSDDSNHSKLSNLVFNSLGLNNINYNINSDIFKIDDIIVYNWKHGTHYYVPLDFSIYKTRKDFIYKAQRPQSNIYIIGEVVSRKHGWVEGCLESVNQII